jgi:hypothetical protein
MTRIIFHSRIVKLERRERVRSVEVIDRNKPVNGNNVVQANEDLGWFIAFEGSREALYVGEEKPEGLAIGDLMKITLEKAV